MSTKDFESYVESELKKIYKESIIGKYKNDLIKHKLVFCESIIQEFNRKVYRELLGSLESGDLNWD